jgi:hypothetical protein
MFGPTYIYINISIWKTTDRDKYFKFPEQKNFDDDKSADVELSPGYFHSVFELSPRYYLNVFELSPYRYKVSKPSI